MDKSFAKYLLPAGLALGLLVVLQAQNQEPTPSPAPAAEPGARPARPIVRPRTVVTPPPAAAPVPAAAPTVAQAPEGDAVPAPAEEAAPAPAPVAPEAPSEPEATPEDTPVPTVETPAAAGAPEAAAPARPRRPANLPGTPRAAGAAATAATAPAAAPVNPVIAAEPGYDPEVPEIEFTESAMDISDIIDKYEAFTGRSTMRDGTIQGTQLPLRSNGKMSRRQAADYIKAFLLLNGYSIIPSDIKGVDKVIPTARGPQVEQGASQLPVYTDPDSLPETEQIINYVLYLKNIGAEEAARSIQAILGQSRQNVSKITPVPAAGALIITDNLPAIRLAIALQDKIDVPSASVVKEFFQLERADAEEVAQVLTDILAAQTKLRSQASGGSGARGVPVNLAAEQLQAGLPPGAVPGAAGGQGAGGSPPPDESTVIVKAITRTNEVLVSGRPSDLTYLGGLIKELDKEANVKNLKRFQLRFIRVEDFLQIAQDAIGRGQEAITGGGAAGGAGGAIAGGARGGAAGRQGAGTGFQGNAAFGGGQTFGANAARGGGSARTGGGGAGGGGLASGRSSSPSSTGQELIPSSTIVGKTLLIAEPRSNTLLVAGPPEHLTRIEEVLDEMDLRPLQVAISAVIAEITLNDDLQYGMDIIRKAENIVAGGQDINWAGALTNLGNSTGVIDPGDLINVADFAEVPGGLNLYAALGEFFNVYVRAVESTGRAQVLSRPFVFTANNKEANISVGRRIPVPSNTQSNVTNGTTTFNTNVEYEDVNLEILVTPLINSKNEVTLNITEINDGLGPDRQVGEQLVPEITQQFLTTEITVPNGGIAVIGGVIQETDNRSNNGVPWLARVPILRGLLGNTSKGRRRSELLMFIQPRIVETSEELEGMHTDQLRRTAVGKQAEEFAKPAYDTSDVILPTENGDVPLDSAHTLLPNDPGRVSLPSGPLPSAPDGRIKALRLDRNGRLQAVDPSQPAAAPDGLETGDDLSTTLPAEKRQSAFWERPEKPAPAPTAPAPAKEEKSGGSKLLPWNWGKKSTTAPAADNP
jgi:general secretion pathway protein D